ncbi:PIN domain-containing protein [Nocardioides sp. YIM 152588]|uniref:PIN domain-containing protein n=1 Tax=Nocardioides sp. YIM 152588 TaxID=3158259 RepID=UPI0032E42053
MIHLDTHVALWLWDADLGRLPRSLQQRLDDEEELAVSPMVRLELAYLNEIGRIGQGADQVLGGLLGRIGVAEDPTPFVEVTAVAQSFAWTRDVFDRVIAAQAVAAGALLATRDRRIRAALPEHTLWD